MNRQSFFNDIEFKLATLSTRISLRGKLNLLELHIHSETFFQQLLNEVYGWSVENENTIKQNVEAIDLIDYQNKLVIQVSATATNKKIESCLEKNSIRDISSYTFKFVSISKDADHLRKKTYLNPHGINFNPSEDIIDISSILRKINSLEIDELKRVHRFIVKELKEEPNLQTLPSNLATVIDVLSKEVWDKGEPVSEREVFEIERKISHNNLHEAKAIIDDHKVHHSKLDSIYSEFDNQGANKSKSVLSSIRQEFISLSKRKYSDDEIFLELNSTLVLKVRESENFKPIPIEELQLCINIIIVDAFIRCQIFKTPDNHVTT